MQIKFFDTFNKKKVNFEPIEKNQVGIYSCGPTVYNYAHIGNLLSYLRWDILRRVFEYNHFTINQVMNITDVDDKTIKAAQERGITLDNLTREYSELFFADIKKLNIESAEHYPKATDHIQEMIGLIGKLLANGSAYKSSDGIYFSIDKFKNYGKLSRLNLEDLQAGAGGRVKADEYDKHKVNDFVLWKFWDESDGDVFWESDLGRGRPGWHIECSAMSRKYLGQPFDIHTGGVDLIFPHHENEIAQSEGAFGKKFANHWIHNEHLLVDNKKMSKSAHNFYILKDILGKNIDPLAFRYLSLTSHYRSKLNFSWKSLEASQNAIYNLRRETGKLIGSGGKIIKQYQERFNQLINDDMNLPEALALTWDLLKSDNSNNDKYATILDFDRVLGLDLDKIKPIKISQDILDLAKKMDQARENKDYELADKLRIQIEGRGYSVQNTLNGSTIEKTV